jgi:hypothetical protein
MLRGLCWNYIEQLTEITKHLSQATKLHETAYKNLFGKCYINDLHFHWYKRYVFCLKFSDDGMTMLKTIYSFGISSSSKFLYMRTVFWKLAPFPCLGKPDCLKTST